MGSIMRDNLIKLNQLVKSEDISKHTDEIDYLISLLPQALQVKLKKVLIRHAGYVLCGADFALT